MSNIQSSINSIIGSAGRASLMLQGIKALKNKTQSVDVPTLSPQAQAASAAQQSVDNEVEAKKTQREQIDQLQTNWGGSVGELPDEIKKKIYEEYNK